MGTWNDEKATTKAILIVEDEGLIAMDLKHRLEILGYFVPAIAKSADDAVRFTGSHHPDLILMDIRLRDAKDGIQAAEEILKKFDVPIIFVTAYADSATLDRAKRTGPFGYIVKPFETTEVRAQIEISLYKHRTDSAHRDSQRRQTGDRDRFAFRIDDSRNF